MENRQLLALLLSLTLAAPVLPAKKTPKQGSEDKAAQAQFQKKLSKDDQIRHALDRLTFGPRPGDFERVKKLGLKKWIDQQLHPDRITEDKELTARLERLDTLSLPREELVRRYPTPQLIAGVARGVVPLPEDPVLRANVQRLVSRYKMRKEGEPGEPMEPAVKLEEILKPEQIRQLRQGTPDQKREILKNVPEEQLDAFVIALPQGLRQQLFVFAEPEMRRKMMVAAAPQLVIANDLTEGKLLRAVYSNRQLEEELVDFWFNHFNVYLDKGSDRFYVPQYERESIRPFALGRFRELLEATAKSPAMLFYLDNWQSIAPPTEEQKKRMAKLPAAQRRANRGLNENYARELMELHTLGVDGGYTQKDIIEVARCFTGWTLRQPLRGGGFEFNERVHDKGEKVVLGVTIPAGGGMEDGLKVLDILATHPSTARFVSYKLAQRFLADAPPAPLVDKMATTFRSSNGDIRSVMKTMLDAKEFWSQGAYRAKVKTPFEMVVSAVRALGGEIDFAQPLANQVAQLGQPLYRKVEPTGYSTVASEWVNSAALLGRMNFALALAQNRVPGVRIDVKRFGAEANAEEIAKAVLFREITPATRQAIEKALAEQKEKNPKAAASPAVLAGLVVGSPEFQRR
jgi:uncharacterized protein (DUF1800 family)